ncbi:MAG TPA: AarF/ABC1/UbiB kinase family protein [Intrasporangium sp.]|uniref:ABC1 kinase family protein n=1 Tax=Intrasporangium sp. TaxID=1925024 RepID=UPI002D77D182|nr:AarF/ABC1/UbiB kinase family protein [Intrasporangium sp.]HET7399616.1 AarF/ABC1/UbiB kinase family protein [Intrasporangium sp.]
MTDLPRKAVVRTAKLATVPLGFAGRTALGLGKRLGGRPAEIVAAELQARTAEQLFQVLGELKGGAMKFGQALSIFEAAFPEELATPYRAMLTKLQDSAPPMPTASVHAVLRTELGPRWHARFRSFEDRPVASASIGQVHRGVWKDGRDVAVKIQYPGAGDALMSDIRQISRVARVTAGWIPGMDLGPILDELRDRMAEELDYRLEASAQGRFAKAFAGDPTFAVPQVLKGTVHVIVSEWMDGTPLSQIIANGTVAQRNSASQLYLEFLLAGPARARLLHADPHPGNFRMTPDGRLGVIDFGAVKHLPLGMPPEIGPLLVAGLDGGAEAVLDGLRRIGFVKSSIDIDPRRLLAYLEPFLAPLRTEEFTFSRAWLRGVFAHINDPRQPNYGVGFKLNLPPEYLLIHRVWGGGIGVLSQLGGTVRGRAAIRALLPGADLPYLA